MMVIQAKKIWKEYKSNSEKPLKVLEGISINVEKGEFLTIMGPSGVGKSTLLYILGTIEQADNGEIIFFTENSEKNLNKMNSAELNQFRNRNIGFVFQFHHLLPEFNAVENVMIPSMIYGESQSKAKKNARVLLDSVGIADKEKQYPAQLSGGEQQRVAIARALINNPAVVLADEPTGNLDEENSQKFISLMNKLRKNTGTTFVLATHSQDIASVADRIIHLGSGKITNIQINSR